MDLTDDDVPGVSKTRHLKYYYYCLTTIASLLPKKNNSSLRKCFIATFEAVILSLYLQCGSAFEDRLKRKKTSCQGGS